MENKKLFEKIYIESKLKSILTESEYEQFQEGKLKNALIGLSILYNDPQFLEGRQPIIYIRGNRYEKDFCYSFSFIYWIAGWLC